MSGRILSLIPEFQPYAKDLVDAAASAGLQPRVTSTLRSYAEQNRLYRRYLAGGSQFPAAPPGTSAHEYGYAMDMVVEPLEALYDVGNYWLQMGGIWSERDLVHFEYPGFRAETPRSNVLKTWAEWFNDLPWYVQLVLPISTFTTDRVISADQVRDVLKRFGF